MSRNQHVVNLSDEERRTLEWFVSTGERKAEDNTRARILLKADDGLTDSEVAAWQDHRNAADLLIGWQFTTDDARIKLRQLYPVEFEEN